MTKILKTIGWLLLGVVIAAALCVVLVHLPGTWNPEERAWSRLPAGTRWAVQIHDAKGLLDAALRDPGTTSLLADAVETVREEFPRAKLGIGDGTRSAADFLDMLGKMRPILSVILPNALLAAGSGFSPAESFLVFQPPVWMRWLGIFQGWDAEVQEQRDDGTSRPVYFALHGDWMITAGSRETVLRIVREWDAEKAPLGADAGVETAHLFLAVANPAAAEPPRSGTEAEPEAAPTHFAFADPFAKQAARAGGGADDAAAGRGAARLLVMPAETGWNVWGEGAQRGGFGTGRLDATLLGEETPVDAPPAPFAVTASLRVSSSAKGDFLTSLPGTSAFPDFLRESWLANTGDVWSLLAGEPVLSVAGAGEDAPYPLLPLFGLGWSLSDGLDAARADEIFTNGLEQLLESLRSPDDSDLLRSFLSTLSISRTGSGGVLNIPPVLVNGARPAWDFGSGDWGWFATDPDAFPLTAPESTLPSPEEGHARIGAGWDFRGNGFFAAATAVIEDRLRNHFADRGTFGERAYRVVRRILEQYPVGNLSGDADTKNRRLEFKAAVSKGNPVE